jgi:hypothetical protein
MKQRRSRNAWIAVALAISVAACGAREAPAADASEGGAVGDAARPSYTVRLDSESSDPSLYRLVEDDDGIRVETGPAGIAFRDDDVVRAGDFLAEATFVLYGAPLGYREAYGIFVGGLDLEEPDQEYTYLLIRSTGDFLVKRRIGEVTETIADWTPHDAVARVAADGDAPSNTLAVEVVGPETRFVVNGVVVHTAPTTRVRPHGIAGVRVNHRLDVRVDDWTLDQRAGS